MQRHSELSRDGSLYALFSRMVEVNRSIQHIGDSRGKSREVMPRRQVLAEKEEELERLEGMIRARADGTPVESIPPHRA